MLLREDQIERSSRQQIILPEVEGRICKRHN